jgi:hypothetical protein
MTCPTLLSALVVCVLPCCGRADEPARLRVFYTGHSFHMFVPGRVGLAAKAAGVKEYQLAGAQGIGGSRVIQHWDKDKGDNAARKALTQGDVDVFTMAPHLKIPDEGIDRFVELGLKHNPKMRFLVQQSWVPYDYLEKRVKDNAERDAVKLDVDRLRADHAKWRGEMETQVKALNRKAGRDAVFIVPAGDAVVKLRTLVAEGKAPGVTKQSELFTDAIGHGKLPIVILVSYCNYACLTGRSPVGLQVKEPAISPELQALLQRIAWDTVSTYPMSGVTAKKAARLESPTLGSPTLGSPTLGSPTLDSPTLRTQASCAVTDGPRHHLAGPVPRSAFGGDNKKHGHGTKSLEHGLPSYPLGFTLAFNFLLSWSSFLPSSSSSWNSVLSFSSSSPSPGTPSCSLVSFSLPAVGSSLGLLRSPPGNTYLAIK